MKRLFFAIGLIALIGPTAIAQSNKEDLAIIQNTYGKQKKEIIQQMIKTDSANSAPFWKAYDEYEAERKDLGLKRIRMIEDYVNNYDKLTPDKTDQLINGALSSDIELTKLQQKYYKKFSKIIGPMQAGKLMQIEDYLRTAVKLKIQDQLPFIDELDKSAK